MDIAKSKLTVKQEKFCLLYCGEHLGNGVQAYGKAFGIDISTAKGHRTARANASRMLTNANIINKIQELYARQGLTDELADKHLLFLINQFADFKVKLGAIKLYNRITGRVSGRRERKSDSPKNSPLSFEQYIAQISRNRSNGSGEPSRL